MTRQVGRGRNGSRSRVDLRGAHSGAAVGLCTQWCGCSKTVSWVLFCGGSTTDTIGSGGGSPPAPSATLPPAAATAGAAAAAAAAAAHPLTAPLPLPFRSPAASFVELFSSRRGCQVVRICVMERGRRQPGAGSPHPRVPHEWVGGQGGPPGEEPFVVARHATVAGGRLDGGLPGAGRG